MNNVCFKYGLLIAASTVFLSWYSGPNPSWPYSFAPSTPNCSIFLSKPKLNAWPFDIAITSYRNDIDWGLHSMNLY